VQADGKILVAGYFRTVGGVFLGSLARLNTDGSLDTSFDVMAGGIIYSIAVQADGKILIAGGTGLHVDGAYRNYAARLNTINTFIYTVTASVGGDPLGGSVTPSSSDVAHGASAVFTVTTNTGYKASVSEGSLIGTTWTIPNVTSTHTATVTFTLN